jgi:hypothetical protein
LPYNTNTSENFQNESQLMATGFYQHVAIGKRLRNRLISEYGLLSTEYTESEIYLQATDKARTQESGLGQMAGLYPNNTQAVHDWISPGSNPTGYQMTWVPAE